MFLFICSAVGVDHFQFEFYSYRTRLFENLRMLPHAPGVQVQGEWTENCLVLDEDTHMASQIVKPEQTILIDLQIITAFLK